MFGQTSFVGVRRGRGSSSAVGVVVVVGSVVEVGGAWSWSASSSWWSCVVVGCGVGFRQSKTSKRRDALVVEVGDHVADLVLAEHLDGRVAGTVELDAEAVDRRLTAGVPNG